MRAVITPLLGCLASLIASGCTTEACACTPPIVPAIVTGRVLLPSGNAAGSAQVHAYSAPAAGCHSIGDELGRATAASDGAFRLGLVSGMVLDSVCVFIVAQPPSGSNGLGNSDPTLLVMDFRSELTADSAQVELILRTS
jgi:hypothetical protein